MPPIRGIDDLRKPVEIEIAPPMTRLADAETTAGTKGRNDWLWRECMRHARSCDNLDALLDFARTCNQRDSNIREEAHHHARRARRPQAVGRGAAGRQLVR